MCALPVLTSALPPSGRAAVPCSGPAYIIGMSIVCFPAVQMVLQYVELAVVPTNSFVPPLRSMALIIGSGPTTRLSTSVLYDELLAPPPVYWMEGHAFASQWSYVKQNKLVLPVCPFDHVCVKHQIFIGIAGRRFGMRRHPTKVSTDVGENLRRSV